MFFKCDKDWLINIIWYYISNLRNDYMGKINIFDIVKPYNNDIVGSMSKVDRDY